MFSDYLLHEKGHLSDELNELLQGLDNGLANLQKLRKLSGLIERSLHQKLEVSICLLHLFETIEIASQKSLQPSQKTEWAFYAYTDYFESFYLLLQLAQSNLLRNEEDIAGQYEYLRSLYKYQVEIKQHYLKRGKLNPLRATLRKIDNLLSDYAIKQNLKASIESLEAFELAFLNSLPRHKQHSERARVFAGAGLIITTDPERNHGDDDVLVVTPHARLVSYVIMRIAKQQDSINHMSKGEFYETLGLAAKDYLNRLDGEEVDLLALFKACNQAAINLFKTWLRNVGGDI